jgi:hypothetical protein
MPFPRMTTRHLLAAVVVLAFWLAFVARAQRLRNLGDVHMRQYALLSRQALDRRQRGTVADERAARASAGKHLHRAQAYHMTADFVESFTTAALLAGVCCGAAVVVRKRRRERAGS